MLAAAAAEEEEEEEEQRRMVFDSNRILQEHVCFGITGLGVIFFSHHKRQCRVLIFQYIIEMRSTIYIYIFMYV